MTTTYFGQSLAAIQAELAQHAARRIENEERRDKYMLDDDSFVSQKAEQLRDSELRRAEALAADGWKTGFVGLCRNDGTTAKGRWVDSKWSALGSWMTTNAAGERVFVRGEDIMASRGGSTKAIEKLAALGFRWESRRCYADARYFYPESARGFAGMWQANLVTYPVDATGRECCNDALVYTAEHFFTDGAGDVAHGIAEGQEWMVDQGIARIAADYPERRRVTKRAA